MNTQISEDNLKVLSQLILKLHNKVIFDINDQQYGALNYDEVLFVVMKIMSLEINLTLGEIDGVNNGKHQPRYFELSEFIISKQTKIIGELSRHLGSICNLDENSKSLALFDTVQFYQKVNHQMPSSFVDFLKGVFPRMNVHTNNLPLYIPFRYRLTDYDSHQLGNPNWQLTRHHIEKLYHDQKMSKGLEEHRWFLILLANPKILEIFKNSTVEHSWAHLYYYYVTQTLKPYSNLSQVESKQQLKIQRIIEIITEKINKQTDVSIKLLMFILRYVLSKKWEDLRTAFDYFTTIVSGTDKNASIQKPNNETLLMYGIINAQFCQLFRHNTSLFHARKQHDLSEIHELNDFQHYSNKSVKLLDLLIAKEIPADDFFLRVSYPANTPQNQKPNNHHLMQILVKQIQTKGDHYQFPKYPNFQRKFMEQLSTRYLVKRPQQILNIVDYLPEEITVWKLLNSEKLNHPLTFQTIKKKLEENKQKYLEIIKHKVNITPQDYDRFIDSWVQYHEFFKLRKTSEAYQQQVERIKKSQFLEAVLISKILPTDFQNLVYVFYKKPQNLQKMMNFMIKGLEKFLHQNNDQTRQETIIQKYLSFLLQPWFKDRILPVLSEQQKTEFWKKWATVYIHDEGLVSELINFGKREQINQNSLQEQVQNIEVVQNAMDIE